MALPDQANQKKDVKELERRLVLAEYPSLRDEVNRTIDRLNTNELICGGFVFSIILYNLSFTNNSVVPGWIILVFSASLALVVAFSGEWRSKIFRRHLDQVDDYLFQLEEMFGNDVGWTHHYRREMAEKDQKRQYGSRSIFWHLLKFFAFANLVIQVFGLLFGPA